MRGLVTAIPAAEGVHDGYDRNPDGIDGPGGQAASGDGRTKLKGTEADRREVVALSKGDEDDEQGDEVEVDDEIEEWDAAVDHKDTGHGVGGLCDGGEDKEEAAEGEEAEEQRRRIFGDVQEREYREQVILLHRPGVGIAIGIEET